MQPLEAICIVIAIQSGLLAAVVERDETPIGANELAKKTGLEELLTGKV